MHHLRQLKLEPRIGDGAGEALHTASYYTGKKKTVFTTPSKVRLPINFRKSRKAMLQNAVHGINELRTVKVQADQFKATSGKTVKYDAYVVLLLSAASNYDLQFTVNNQ